VPARRTTLLMQYRAARNRPTTVRRCHSQQLKTRVIHPLWFAEIGD
jgi:hypothetical protein